MNRHGSKVVGFPNQDVRSRHNQMVQSRGWLNLQRPLSSALSPKEPSRNLHQRGHGTPRGGLCSLDSCQGQSFSLFCAKNLPPSGSSPPPFSYLPPHTGLHRPHLPPSSWDNQRVPVEGCVASQPSAPLYSPHCVGPPHSQPRPGLAPR